MKQIIRIFKTIRAKLEIKFCAKMGKQPEIKIKFQRK